MKITYYSFGKIDIDGKTYTSDVIIYPDRVDASWWRKEGHYLQIEDITQAIKEKPEIIIIGTGYFGAMRVSDEALSFLTSKNIIAHVEKTGKAVELFNNMPKGKKVIALLHLTC
ncbi:MAG: hypothetical protein HZC10_09970 [Nitrospirae bacterium]|nr:hypothetical protein [Nitrospirota bacterium]